MWRTCCPVGFSQSVCVTSVATKIFCSGLGGAMGGSNSPVKPLQSPECALVLFFLLPTCLRGYAIYQICSPVPLSCGEKGLPSVVAPFRIDGQPESCGRKSFRLFCHGEFPAIQINSATYWVKEIDYQNMILTLVNMDFVGSLCPSNFVVTTLDVSPFVLAFNVLRVPIRYNCSCQSEDHQFWALPCPANASASHAYLAPETFFRHPYWGCSCPDAAIYVALLNLEFEDLAGRGSIDSEGFMEVLVHGFQVLWSASLGSGGCKECKMSGGNCTGTVGRDCSCPGGTYYPMCPSPGAAKWGTSKKVIIGITLGIGGFFVAGCFLSYLYCHLRHCKMLSSTQESETRRKLRQTKYIEAFLKTYGSIAPKRYKYSELEKMTNSFSDTIGRGGFATVFKGKLRDGCPVAVKVLRSSKSNGKDFVNEVVSIGCTYHVNIVGLLGYCLEGPVRALIYEFMTNGSLEKFIFGDKRGTIGWEKLYEITVGIARGLEYLHRGCQMSILHFDIKPHNILLDDEFCPKISDFGLAKLCGMEKSDVVTSGAGGTVGYIAPEVINRSYGRVSSKSDVYSYGMMVLEMVGGRKNFEPLVDHTSEVYYPHWVYKHLGLDGFKICGELTEDEEIVVRRMVMVGLLCIRMNPAERPSINQVVAMLEGRIKDLDMPWMPVLHDPPETEVSMMTLTL